MPMPVPMHSMTTLLPGWVRVVWVVALAVVAVLHIWHGATMSGQARWWHSVHTAMALGMIGMYATDPMRQRGLYYMLAVLFAVIAVALAVTAIVVRRRERVLNPLWVVTAVDSAAMSYMAAVMLSPSAVPAAVTWVVVAYLACDALAWLLGVWDRAVVSRGPSVALSGHNTLDITLTLAVMAASMAYMLAAMIS
jgi:Domain of unknown function (DUF5134)